MKDVTNETSIFTDDPHAKILLGKITAGMHVMSVREDETIFSQGDCADSVYFVQSGIVKISVVSSAGKEGVLAIIGPHSFFGEESLTEQTVRPNTATATAPSIVVQVEKRAMARALHAQSELAEVFIAFLLKRSLDLEEDLADQLFNHSEKRLARVLLKLAQVSEHPAVPDSTVPRLSHETLAEMVGTTRSRITHFMNKFRKEGLIEYSGHARGRGFGMIVRTRRLNDIVLHE